MLQRDEGLWCNMFQQKYLKSASLTCASYKKPPACSNTWSSVYYGASLLRQGLVWRIGNGEAVHFLTDSWSGFGPLYDKALDPSVVDNDLLVQDFWLDSDWDVTLLYACFPDDIDLKILCIPISRCNL